MRAAGFVTSLAPMTSATSVRGELRVDVVHLLELVVRHVGLGEQHVHVARHAAGDRVDRRRAPRRRAARARRRGRRPRAAPGRRPCRSRGRRRRAARRRAGSRRRRRSSSARCRRRRGRRRRRRRAPRPPKNTLPIERFIASAICLVRIEPDAPTSMPATISAVLSSARPAAAALRPVNAFSVEITTGMSAPPIGSTASTPSAPARQQDQPEQQLRLGAGGDDHREPDRDQREHGVDRLRDPEAALERLLELEERDDRAPEGDRADDRREQDRDQRLELRVAAAPRAPRGTRRR